MANETEILDRTTLYLDVEHTYRGIEHIDMVPNLSPQNLASVEIGKDFMLSHGYIKNDFDVQQWAAPEFLIKPPASWRRRNGKSEVLTSFPKPQIPWRPEESSASRAGVAPPTKPTKPSKNTKREPQNDSHQNTVSRQTLRRPGPGYPCSWLPPSASQPLGALLQPNRNSPPLSRRSCKSPPAKRPRLGSM